MYWMSEKWIGVFCAKGRHAVLPVDTRALSGPAAGYWALGPSHSPE